MESVKKILDAFDTSCADMEINDRHTISVDGFMDLTIEKVGKELLSVAHYYHQRGDLMRDPEVVFDTGDREWRAVEYRQDPGIHKHDPEGLDISNDLKLWNSNLEKQGFVDAARDQRESEE